MRSHSVWSRFAFASYRPSPLRTSLLLLAASVVLAASGPASAQDGTGLPYSTVTRDAQVVAPDLASGRARSAVAASGVGVSRIVPNPVVAIGSSTNGPKIISSLTVPLPITRRASAIRAAESAAGVAAAEVPLLQIDARLAAANAWCDLWLSERTRDVAEETVARARRILAAAEERLRDGSGPRLDVVRATAEAARTRAELVARVELVADASSALSYWLGRDPTVLLHVTGTPPVAGTLAPLSELVARLEGHPLLARSAARTRAALATVALQKSQIWPSIGAQLGATLADSNLPKNNFSAGLVFDVPVFTWNRPAVAQAERGTVQVTAESDAAASRLRSDLVSAHAVLKAAVARADAAERDVLPASRLAADLTRDAYQTGAVDLSAVIVAEKALADAKLATFDALAQRGRAIAALEHALGGPL